MAKLKFKLIEIYAPSGERPALMKRLQELAVIDIETAAGDEATGKCPEGYTHPDTGTKIDIYERGLAAADEALKILNERFPEKKGLLASFSGPPAVSPEEFYLSSDEREQCRALAGKVINADRRIAEQRAEIIRLRTTAAQMEPWASLDVPLSFRGTQKTAAMIGTVSGHYTLEELLAALAEQAPDLIPYVEIVNADKDSTYLFLCCPAEQRELAEEALRVLAFARPVQNTSRLPREKLDSKYRRIENCEQEIVRCNAELEQAAEQRERLKRFSDLCRSRADHYRTLAKTDQTAHTALIRGYVPEEDLPKLREVLEREFTAVIEETDADEEFAPVKLKNNWFASPAETITKMYSLPSKQDIDPTPLTGFFYYLLFGMMLSDAGYGLLIVLGTLFGLKKLKPSPQMRQTMKMFLYCGISTMMWGFLFGSFFGDAIPVISETFFGHRIALPAVMDPMHGGAVKLLILSIIIGFVQIMAGLAAKFVTCLKNGDKAGAYLDTGLWITILIGIALLAGGIVAGKMLTTVGAVIAIASAVGLILTQGRDKKNPVLRIISGITSLYDITGYVSDLLSFSRLMALGLTTAAMGAVFNLLGTLGGKSVAGALLMLIIFPVGHALCFALNVLGAYVHTLRLQYVELFSKFYEGGGREFKAFSFKNKYVSVENTQIKEEN